MDQNYNPIDMIVASLGSLVTQIISAIPLIITALIIWMIGNWLIGVGISLLKKLDLKNTKLDDWVREVLIMILRYAGKFFLVLIILDFLGIGSTIVGAVAQGFTLAVAIAIGLAFGHALTTEARMIVDEVKKRVMR